MAQLKKFLEPAMFCHLAVCTQTALWRGKRPKVHAKQKEFKNFFSTDLKVCKIFSNLGDICKIGKKDGPTVRSSLFH